MYQFGYLLLIALFSMVALINWRRGIYLLIVVAAIQDPARKMMPGAPGYIVLSILPLWSAILLSFYTRQRGLWGRFQRYYPYLASVLVLLLVWMIVPAAIASTYGRNSYLLALLGAMSYGIAFLGVLVGFHFPRHGRDMQRFFIFYCIVHGVMVLGAALEQIGVSHRMIGTNALGAVWVRYTEDGVVKMVSGFYRSPDVLGWHAVTVCMLSLALAHLRTGFKRYLWAAWAAWSFVGVMLCSRRKMAFMIPLFVLVMLYVHMRASGKRRAIAAPVGVLVVALILAVGVYFEVGRSEEVEQYYFKSGGEVAQRLEKHGVDALVVTYRQAGFFGMGLGSATQGRRYLKPFCAIPDTWQEGGLSRLLVELGVPGFVLALWVFYALFTAVWSLIKRFRLYGAEFPLFAGLIAILVANAGSFIVSGQIFGDLFVNTFMAMIIGVLLAGRRLMTAGRPSARAVQPPETASRKSRALQPA